MTDQNGHRVALIGAALTALLTAGLGVGPILGPAQASAAVRGATADTTPPEPAVITSDDYPNDDLWHAGVGDYGSFTFDSPSSDVTQYRYRFTGETWKTIDAETAGGPATVRWMPTCEAPWYLDVQAVDAAGNAQQTPTSYIFKVGDGRAPAAGWTLDDPPGATVAAGISGSPDATPGSGVTFGTQGPLGSADTSVALNGSVNGYLDSGAPAVDTSHTFSVAAWVNVPEKPAEDVTVISQSDGNAQPGFALGYDAGGGSWSFRTSTNDGGTPGKWQVSGAKAVPDSWTHLLGVYDSEIGALRLYANGALVDEDIQPGHTLLNATGDLQIGRHASANGYAGHMEGRIADVMVYDRVVPAPEAETLGKRAPTQQSYWPAETAADGVSPEAFGRTGLTLGGGAEIYHPAPSCDPEMDPECVPAATPLWGEGHLALNGTDAYATRPAGLLANADSFTLGVRARLAATAMDRDQTVLSLAGSQGTAAKVSYDASTRSWQLTVTDSDGDQAQTTTVNAAGATPSSQGIGHHLALVYSAVTGKVLLYVNGTLAAEAAWDNSWDFSTTTLQVGRTLTGSTATDHFAGAVDELRVFRGAMDGEMVVTLSALQPGSSF